MFGKNLFKILFCIISLCNITFSQVSKNVLIFSHFELSIIGGLNSSNYKTFGPSFIIEGKSNITSHIYLTLSIGYSRSYEDISSNVKTFQKIVIQGVEEYQTIFYDITKKGFDIIPITIGIQYFFNYKKFFPYLITGIGYNSVGIKVYTTDIHYTGGYDSFFDLPDEYKTKYVEPNITNSYQIELGFGTKYHFSKNISVDLRYLFDYNNNLINTHKFLIGISI
jgi:hypothetical protein